MTLIDRLNEARRFNQGFETVEYTASALIDMALHSEIDPAGVDISAFERAEMRAHRDAARDPAAPPASAFRPSVRASSGYAAGYYVYLWAEVLDADGYDAFVEAGNPFDPDVAERSKRYIYSSGGTLPPAEAFRSFRGRDPRVEPLLAQRGLADVRAAGVATARAEIRARSEREPLRDSGLQLRDARHRRQEVEPGVALQRQRAGLQVCASGTSTGRPRRCHDDDIAGRAAPAARTRCRRTRVSIRFRPGARPRRRLRKLVTRSPWSVRRARHPQ